MSKNNFIELFKKEIEKKFVCKIEKIDPKDIREIFLPYAKNKNSFNLLSDEELVSLYVDWCKQYNHLFRKKITETEQPDIEDN